MKRITLIILTALLAVCFIRPVFAAQQPPDIGVLIDGLPVNFDVPPVIYEGRTLVPFRAVSEALNIGVNWDASTQTITAQSQDKEIVLQIGSQVALVNGVSSNLEVAPRIINNRTLIPLRFFTESLGCMVDWDQQNYLVKISSPARDMNVIGFYALGDSTTSSWKSLFGASYPEVGVTHADLIKEIAVGWYSIDAEGNLLTNSGTGWQRPEGWEKVLDTAKTYNLKADMIIHLPDRDSTFNNLMANEEAVNKVIAAITSEAQTYQGVNLDIEGLGWKENGSELTAVKNNYTRFVRLLADKLKASEKSLTLTLHPPNSAYQGYDYQALGAIADRIIVMAYDYGPKPEPTGLVMTAVATAVQNVQPDKIILGISLPSENPESIKSKIGIAKKYNLNGIALWRLGLVTTETWDVLKTTIKVGK
ncbi:MAG: stalk domain-containing protein [Methylocystaceae bacterium]